MLPFEAPTIFETIPKYFFHVPRVVQDQKSKFETDELFRKLCLESEVVILFLFSEICAYSTLRNHKNE
jgi:hypothetical protein